VPTPPRARVCWNCDQVVRALVRVDVRGPLSGHVSVALCHSCYTLHYLPLMRVLADQDGTVQRRPDVLIVEDDPALLMALSLVLECEGYRVDTASSGEDALAKVWSHVPGVIVLDVKLPVISGTRVLETLRQTLPQRRIPIVMMTGHDQVSEHDHQAANAFLRKPFTMDALLSVVRDVATQPSL
jgi:CheY-like chemotaxis protein